MQKIDSINIFGVNVSKLTNELFLEYISESILRKEKRVIGYANADTLNKIYEDNNLKKIYTSFDLIHPDGVGIYSASRFLCGEDGLRERFTGSDLYPLLIERSLENNWSYFFFGHSRKILDSISMKYPQLNIAGVHEGYEFNDSEVIKKINSANPDILIIGLSCPVQEKWIFENSDKINFRNAILVGDGIRIFTGKKIRGPVFLRKMGLEWVVRYFTNPIGHFKKYIIGVPLFIVRCVSIRLKQ